MWEKKKRHSWKIDTDQLKGEASVKQSDGGYKIFLKVEEKDFGMTLRNRSEYFESKKEAVEEIKKEMKEFQA